MTSAALHAPDLVAEIDRLYPSRLALLLVSLCAPAQAHNHCGRPCESPGKIPMLGGWNSRAIERWRFAADREAHIARAARHLASGGNLGWTIPPGVLVLDADSPEAVRALEAVLGDAPMQESRPGRAHFAVRVPEDMVIRSTVGLELAPGILADLRAANSAQIVVEPSIHAEGAAYCWKRELPEDLSTLPDLPPEWLARITEPLPQRSTGTKANGGKVREGGRNQYLFKHGCSLRTRGRGETEIREELHTENERRCDPPLSDAEVDAIADSIMRYAAGHGEDGTEPREHPSAETFGDPGRVVFTGRRLVALLERPAPPPMYAGIPAPGHLTLKVAPALTGKTSLSCKLALARAAGVAPWAGAPVLEHGRVLLVSLDEAVEQVARRMRSLEPTQPARRLEDVAERIVVIGPDRETPPGALEQLRLDSQGLENLERIIVRAKDAGDPFHEVYLDAYADFIPIGESESSNEEATRIGGALEAIAVRTGAAIVLLHHVGKPKADAGDDLPDIRFIGRGASALAAKARVVMSLELVAGQPHLRRIRTATNLATPPKPALFEVCKPEAPEGELVYFKPFDPIAAYDPKVLLTPGEKVSTSDLAWRLSGREPEGKKQPPGDLKSLAAKLRDEWQRRGLVDVVPGPRRAKLISIRGAA